MLKQYTIQCETQSAKVDLSLVQPLIGYHPASRIAARLQKCQVQLCVDSSDKDAPERRSVVMAHSIEVQ